jgi:exosortase/archaeosortase family protein
MPESDRNAGGPAAAANNDAATEGNAAATGPGAGSSRVLVKMIAVFLLIFGSFYLWGTTESYQEHVFAPYLVINADLSGDILNALGQKVIVDGPHISSSRFNVTIARGCDGLPPMALFLAALGAFPAPVLLKLPALLLCLPILAAFNLVRIVSLFLVGVYYPDYFHVMHVDVWQALYILFGVVLFCLWLWWASGRSARVPT